MYKINRYNISTINKINNKILKNENIILFLILILKSLILQLRKRYNVNIVGIKKGNRNFIPNLSADTIIEQGDILLVITDAKTAAELKNLK